MEKAKFHSPLCLRLTPEERLRLEQDAGDMTLSAYVRLRLFAPENIHQRRWGKRPVKDRQELGRLLAGIGQSRIANNLNQLARAVNSGSLPVCPETEQAIYQAYEHVVWMRQTIIKALALQPEEIP
jgi:hypothetical protein